MSLPARELKGALRKFRLLTPALSSFEEERENLYAVFMAMICVHLRLSAVSLLGVSRLWRRGSHSLQTNPVGRIVWRMGMKTRANSQPRIELGRHIVADPRICGGQPTFKGTRIMVWIVLDQLGDGLTWDQIVHEWDGKVPQDAIAEAIAIADLVVK